MIVGIPTEIGPSERRVAGTPDTVTRLKKLGFDVQVQRGAGERASLADALYEEAGARLIDDASTLWESSQLVLKMEPPTASELEHLQEGAVLIAMLSPDENSELLQAIADRKASALALDKIPRISRAQKMDVLSSMANISGYRAIVEAAHRFGRFFGGQITAAGKSPPAKVLVIGAGVAGLAAIAAARSLGAQVRAFDVRLAAKEQCESLGAEFLTVEIEESGDGGGGYAKTMSPEFIAAEMALFASQAEEVDIIVTTALIPGRKAPILITQAMVDSMGNGSVIVDLAAKRGGNCEATVPGEIIESGGVTVIGLTDLTSNLPTHASQFFGTNLVNLLTDLGGAEGFALNVEDEVVRKSVCVRDGEVTWPPPHEEPPPASPPKPVSAAIVPAPPPPRPAKKGHGHGAPAEPASLSAMLAGLVAAVALAAVGQVAPSEFIQHVTVFVLACFVGWQVVWSVAPALHTPLMSVTNAISGIIIVGGLLQAGTGEIDAASLLGVVAIFVASINVAGGFLVTQRMLAMFQRGN